MPLFFTKSSPFNPNQTAMEFIYQSCITSLQTLAIVFGSPMIIMSFMHMVAGKQAVIEQVLLGTILITLATITPSGPTNELPALDEQFLHQIA